VIQKLEALNLPTKISIPESAEWNNPDYTYDMFKQMMKDPVISSHVDHFSARSYVGNATEKKKFAKMVANSGYDIELHQTEWAGGANTEDIYGNPLGIESAMVLAGKLHEDLAILNVTMWEFWLAINMRTTYPDSLIYIQGVVGPATPTKRLYVLGNYSLFLPGSTRVDMSVGDANHRSFGNTGKPNDVYGTAYLSEDGKQTIVVMTNETKEERSISFSGVAGKTGRVYETTWANNLMYKGDVDPLYGYVLPAESVTTFVFE